MNVALWNIAQDIPTEPAQLVAGRGAPNRRPPMSESFVLSVPALQDNYAHPVPADADQNWQETWWVAWYDPDQKVGGFHHYGLQHGRGYADVWDWVVVDGQVVTAYQCLDLPMPTGEFPDLEIGTLRVQTKEPTTAFTVTSQQAGTTVNLRYQAFREPVEMKVGSSAIFSSHYESMGTAEGTLHHDGRAIEFSGVGFQDHSWGPRNHRAMVTHRWFWAVFGSDLYMTAYGGYHESGRRRVFGYVQNGEHREIVTEASFGLRVHDDGFSPAGCDIVLTTESGVRYRISGESDAGQPISHHDDFLMTDAVTRFECDGRSGAGILECHELGSPAVWQTELHAPAQQTS